MNELAIILDSNSKKYLYEQIYEYIVTEIRTGKLLYNEKLPSTRFLADYLQISRSTVELAYEQLTAEGYIESRPYRGYYVAKIEELFSIDNMEIETKKQKEKKETPYQIDFSPNGVEAAAFPFSVWRKIQKEALADNSDNLFEAGDSKGEIGLRTAIARYLHASRGVKCNSEQMIIGAGNDYLLMLLGKIFGERKMTAMEEYTYKRAYQVLKGCGYSVSAIKTDANGISVDDLRKTQTDMVYVMPSHQFPLGTIMPVGRRLDLLTWANEEENRYIIEDDYDGEFRYKGKPIPALQALDKNGRVIYIGTFSKSIAPAIRISYMVLPLKLLERYRRNACFYASTVSRIEQKALESFITKGHFERHLNKMRKIYKAKHDTLLAELVKLKGEYTVFGENAGLHVLLRYNGNKNETQLVQKAAEGGVKVYVLSEYAISDRKHCQEKVMILGFAGLSERQIREGIEVLESKW